MSASCFSGDASRRRMYLAPSLDLRLDGGLVGLPAFLLEVGPGDADHLALGLRRGKRQRQCHEGHHGSQRGSHHGGQRGGCEPPHDILPATDIFAPDPADIELFPGVEKRSDCTGSCPTRHSGRPLVQPHCACETKAARSSRLAITRQPRPLRKSITGPGRRIAMKAAYFEEFGGPEVLQYGDLPDPVAAPARWSSMCTRQASMPPTGNSAPGPISGIRRQSLPFIPGRDFSGVIGALGQGVTDFKVGDAVFGVLNAGREGTYCEKLAITAAIIAKKPDALSHVERRGLGAYRSHGDRLARQYFEAQARRDHPHSRRRRRRCRLRHSVRQTYRRACDHDDERGQPRLCEKPRRRPNHRLHHGRFHQTRVRLRRRIRYGRRRRRDKIFRGAQTGRPRRVHRVRHGGAEADAERRDIAPAAGRARPRAARPDRKAVRRRRDPPARGQALSDCRKRPTRTGSASRATSAAS